MGRWANFVNVPGIATCILVLCLWQASVATGLLDFEYLPAPLEVIGAFGTIFRAGVLLQTVGHTLWVTLVSSGIAILGGLLIGAAVGLIPIVRAYTLQSIDVMRSLPVIALMPVALLVWGPAPKTEIIVAAFGAVWLMAINTAAGMRQVHPRLIEVARTFRFSPREIYSKIIFPAALPSILVGARLAVIHALVITIVAEIVINPQGLGGALYESQMALQPAQMWAWVMICGFVGYSFNIALIAGARKALPSIEMNSRKTTGSAS